MNFEQIHNLPTLDLQKELFHMISNGILNWGDDNQICINTTPGNENNYHLGSGSLTHNWENKTIITDENGNKKQIVPLYDNPYSESDFTVLCKQFKNTQFEVLYNILKDKYNIGRIRLMKMKVKYSMSWHNDSSPRLHYPIKTQTGCFMLIEDEVKHLPQNTWWLTDTTKMHTAFNASREERIHLVVTL